MRSDLQGHLAMLTFSALVAGSFSLGSMSANMISPAALNAARFVIAGVVIAVAVAATTGITREAGRAPWRYVILGGLFAVYFVLMFEGLKTARPVSAAAVFTLTPIIAAGFGWLLLRQKTTLRMAMALAIGAVGALWVIFRADLAALQGFEVGRGEAVYFVGCVSHALYTPMVRKLNRGEPAVVFTLGTLIGGGAFDTFGAEASFVSSFPISAAWRAGDNPAMRSTSSGLAARCAISLAGVSESIRAEAIAGVSGNSSNASRSNPAIFCASA